MAMVGEAAADIRAAYTRTRVFAPLAQDVRAIGKVSGSHSQTGRDGAKARFPAGLAHLAIRDLGYEDLRRSSAKPVQAVIRPAAYRASTDRPCANFRSTRS